MYVGPDISVVVGGTCRWGNNVTMDFKEMRNKDVEWICFSQDMV